MDGVIQRGARTRVELQRVQCQRQKLLAVIAPLAIQHHQGLTLQPGRQRQLVTDAGQARGIAAVLAKHNEGPDQEGHQPAEQTNTRRANGRFAAQNQALQGRFEAWPTGPARNPEQPPPDLTQPALLVVPRGRGRNRGGRPLRTDAAGDLKPCLTNLLRPKGARHMDLSRLTQLPGSLRILQQLDAGLR